MADNQSHHSNMVISTQSSDNRFHKSFKHVCLQTAIQLTEYTLRFVVFEEKKKFYLILHCKKNRTTEPEKQNLKNDIISNQYVYKKYIFNNRYSCRKDNLQAKL